MLQIDHVYEFFYNNIFKEKFDVFFCNSGVVNTVADFNSIHIFTPGLNVQEKIFFYDQEPIVSELSNHYFDMFDFPIGVTPDKIEELSLTDNLPYNMPPAPVEALAFLRNNPHLIYKRRWLVTSEKSNLLNGFINQRDYLHLYYFFHGFAALDWYRGFYALNYNKTVIKDYTYDYITFNRLVSNDRSYRCYLVSLLAKELLLEHGQISFGLTTEQASWQEEIADPNTKLSPKAITQIQLHAPSTPLIIDNEHILGSASADIPRCTNDSFWHIVTETVFYYDKLHLTEKIFKPIVMKQPFMLLAAPGNLAYLKSYGFKTFEGIIDESYDSIQDPDQRTEAVVEQLAWYCCLSAEEKRQVIEAIAPIVEYNFHHFYGEFKHIITRELLDNTKQLFKEIGYDDSTIAYQDIYQVLTN